MQRQLLHIRLVGETACEASEIQPNRYSHADSSRLRPKRKCYQGWFQEVADSIYHVPEVALHLTPSSSENISAVLDIGVPCSVVGVHSARRIMRRAGRTLELLRSSQCFRFGNSLAKSLGTCLSEIPTPGGILEIQADVVNQENPFLVGLDVLDRERLQVLTVENNLQCVGIPGGKLG
jgi:hypothetical protein